MKNIKIKYSDGRQSFQLLDNQVLSIDARAAQIDCYQGRVWVTWPNGNERVLQRGQSMSAGTNGLICIQAFAPSTINVRRIKHHTAFYVPQLCSECAG